jgi:Putative prokaryotic signal transducing protein
MPSPEASSRSSDFVLVFTAATIPEGLAARGLLESQGIAVETKGEVEGPYRFGPMYLYVPAEFEVQARALLEDLEATEEPAEAEWGQPEDPA